jgi:hypothetical protein
MQIIRSMPLFGIILVAYMAVGVLSSYNGPAVDPSRIFGSTVTTVILPSAAEWRVQVQDLIIVIGLFSLFIEIIKSTRSSDQQIVEHILSTFVFISYIVAFLWAPIAATSTFFFLMVMSLIDVIAGFTITIAAARRDLSVG